MGVCTVGEEGQSHGGRCHVQELRRVQTVLVGLVVLLLPRLLEVERTCAWTLVVDLDVVIGFGGSAPIPSWV